MGGENGTLGSFAAERSGIDGACGALTLGRGGAAATGTLGAAARGTLGAAAAGACN